MGNTLQKPPGILPTQHEEEQQYLLKENELDNQEFTCEICIKFTSNPENKFKNADKCSHPFCTNCIIKYIHVKLENYNIGQIKCPALNCDHALDPFACAQLIGPPLFLRWSDVLCEAMIVNWDTCYCPYKNCNVLIVNECGGYQKKSECPICKRLFCFKCGRVWHAGFRCEESEGLRDENEMAFGRLAEEMKWMRCPKCRHFVERTRGCRSVRCRCGNSFCYNCGADHANNPLCCVTTSRVIFECSVFLMILLIIIFLLCYLIIYI